MAVLYLRGPPLILFSTSYDFYLNVMTLNSCIQFVDFIFKNFKFFIYQLITIESSLFF